MRLITLAVGLMLTSIVAAAQQTPVRIELAEFQRLHAAKKILVVDVRDEESYAAAHIPGAVNIPLGEEEQAKHFNLLKNEKRPIVTYCA